MCRFLFNTDTNESTFQLWRNDTEIKTDKGVQT